MDLVALSNGDVLLVILAISIPAAALSFVGAGAVYREIGKGQFSMDREQMLLSPREADGPADEETVSRDREAEIRQMLEAKAFRQRARGEVPLDIDAETQRLLSQSTPPTGQDPALVEEVRQLVIARNSRRKAKGEPPLDVETEVSRQLRDLDNLGQ